jgi:hypothetical protein
MVSSNVKTGVNEKARKNKGFMAEGNLRQHLNGLEGCPEWTFNQGVMGSNPIGLTNKNNVLSDRIGVEDVGKVAQ